MRCAMLIVLVTSESAKPITFDRSPYSEPPTMPPWWKPMLCPSSCVTMVGMFSRTPARNAPVARGAGEMSAAAACARSRRARCHLGRARTGCGARGRDGVLARQVALADVAVARDERRDVLERAVVVRAVRVQRRADRVPDGRPRAEVVRPARDEVEVDLRARAGVDAHGATRQRGKRVASLRGVGAWGQRQVLSAERAGRARAAGGSRVGARARAHAPRRRRPYVV